jgi:DNA-binding FadR family transcriptional regulator
MDNSTLYRPVQPGNETLSMQVAHQIADLIAHRQLKAGDRLPSLDELPKYLEVSRTAVREAIKLLDAWGAVTVRHGVGTFVAESPAHALTVPFMVSSERSEETLRSLLQVRQVLEPEMAAIAAENATAEHVKQMEEALLRMRTALSLNSPEEFHRSDLAFHMALAQATGNYVFPMVVRPVIYLLFDMFDFAYKIPGCAERIKRSHRITLEHIKAGRPTMAREAKRYHLDQLQFEIQCARRASEGE